MATDVTDSAAQHRLAWGLLRSATDAEAKLWSRSRNRRLEGLKFRRQVPVTGNIADYVCVDAKLIVEVDGSQHDERIELDLIRTAALQRAGFEVIRFWNSDVLTNIDAVLATILEHVHGATRLSLEDQP